MVRSSARRSRPAAPPPAVSQPQAARPVIHARSSRRSAARVVLGVEAQMAAVVLQAGPARARRHAPAEVVHDLRGGREEDAATPPGGPAGTDRHPLRRGRTTRRSRRRLPATRRRARKQDAETHSGSCSCAARASAARRRAVGIARLHPAHEPALPPFRTGVSTVRTRPGCAPSRPTCAVPRCRPRAGRRGSRQGGHAPGADLAVAVQDQRVRTAAGRAQAEVVGAREAEVRGVRDGAAPPGKRARTAAADPSVLALSTTITSWAAPPDAWSASRQRSRSSRVLYETTIALTRGTGPPGPGAVTAGARPAPGTRHVRRAVSAQENGRGQGLAAADEVGAQRRSSRSTRSMAAATASSSPRLDEQRRHPEDLVQRRAAAGHDGDPARHRLQRGQPEALVVGQEDRDVGGGVAQATSPASLTGRSTCTGAGAPELRDQRLDVEARLGAVVAHDLEGELGPGAAQGRDGAQQHGQPPPVQDRARGEDHRARARPASARASSRGGDGGRSSSAAARGMCATRGAQIGKALRDLAPREIGAGQDRARRAQARGHGQAAAHAVDGAEVVRAGEEGHVVHGGHARPGRRVSGQV